MKRLLIKMVRRTHPTQSDALSNDDGTIDLNSDIVTGGASLLQQINQLPEMLANGWQLAQDAETGEYYVMVSDIRRVKNLQG